MHGRDLSYDQRTGQTPGGPKERFGKRFKATSGQPALARAVGHWFAVQYLYLHQNGHYCYLFPALPQQ